MKNRLIITLISITLFFELNAQNLLTENFNYTSTNIANNGWFIHSGTADSIATITGLTYSGYNGSGVGNAANVIGAGYDYNLPLSTSQSANNAVIYTSLLLKFTEVGTTALAGTYFFLLGNRVTSTNFTSFCNRLWTKMDGSGNISLGLSNGASANYLSAIYAKNVTYLVVFKYKINTSGNDTVSMWIKSSGVPATELAAGAPDTTISMEAGQDVINAIAIRQAAGIPDYVIDGIRVGSTWATTVLPVSLVNYDIQLNNDNTVNLSWTTSKEANNNYFEVMKSNDGENYLSIGKIKGQGNSNVLKKYYFIDQTPLINSNYYKLFQYDFDGKKTELGTKYIKALPTENEIKIFPNPTNGIVNLNITSGKFQKLELMDLLGKIILTKTVAPQESNISFDVSDIKLGIYNLRLTGEDGLIIKQLVKQ